MIIDCLCGLKKFKVDDSEIPAEGRKVKCGACNQVWFYDPANPNASEPIVEEPTVQETIQPNVPDVQETPIPQNVEETISQAEDEAPFVEESDADTDLGDQAQPKPGMKIFADDDADLPSKAQMDNALEDFKSSRKKKSFFGSLFAKKDPLEKAKKTEKKVQQTAKTKKKKKDTGSATRLLIYLLIILLFVLSVFLVPYKAKILMAFPQLDWYFEALTPYYNTIKGMLFK